MDKNKNGIKKKKKATMPGDRNERREYMRKIQNPISEYDKKGKLKYTAASKGGGADTGRKGEIKSKLAVAIDKVKRSGGLGKRPKPKLTPPERGPMRPLRTKLKEGGMARGGGAAIRGTKFQGVF